MISSRRLTVVAVALGVLATSAPGASAAAPSDTDLLCGFTSATDPNPEAPENTQTGEIDGGPIAQNGTITCTIKVGANKFHSSPVGNGAQAEATGTNGVTVLSPTLVSYTAEPLETVYVCDQFTDSDGNVWVYDDVDRAWEYNNSTAECRRAISASDDDPLITGIEEAVDGIACPVLATAGPSGLGGTVEVRDDGDVMVAGELVYNCPPYESSGGGPGDLVDLGALAVADVLCGFSGVADPLPSAPEDVMTGYVAGGPIARSGTLRCTIQVGGRLHVDPDNGAVATASGNGFTMLSPTLISYAAPPLVPVYVCDQFTGSTGTFVYDDRTDQWRPASTSGATCRSAVTVDSTTLAQLRLGSRQPMTGRIEVSSLVPGVYNVSYYDFDPPLAEWNCTVDDASPTVTCTPSAAVSGGRRFLCDQLDVVAEHNGVGAVVGSSACGGGSATAVSTGPPTPAAWAPGGSVPWTCAADPSVVGPWKVTCEMFGTSSGAGRVDHGPGRG